LLRLTLIKKKTILIYKEIQKGAVAKSYMTNGGGSSQDKRKKDYGEF
jgi:hypothetical protein